MQHPDSAAENRLRGWAERSATFLDPTITYAEVREQTPPLTRKDNQEQLPHLWKPPPDPEMRSPAGSPSREAPEIDRLGGTIDMTAGGYLSYMSITTDGLWKQIGARLAGTH